VETSVSAVLPEELSKAAPPAIDVPPGTVCFSQQSHMGVDLSVAGEAVTRAALGWTGCTWSDEEVSGSGQYRGVQFNSSLSYVMPGLKSGSSSKRDSYAEIDYGLYCSPSGRIQVYERGFLMYTDKDKFSESTILQLRIENDAVEYVVDGRVAYVSTAQPERLLHFAISWHDHPASVSNIRYVKGS